MFLKIGLFLLCFLSTAHEIAFLAALSDISPSTTAFIMSGGASLLSLTASLTELTLTLSVCVLLELV